MLSIKELILLALAMGSISAYIAIRKKKNPIAWFFAGFLFGLPGVIFTFFSPFKTKPSLKGFQKLRKASLSSKAPPPPKPVDRRLWYYLDQKNEQCGPMSINALKDTWEKRKVGPQTFVWNDELENWKKIEELSDFEELFYGKSKKVGKS